MKTLNQLIKEAKITGNTKLNLSGMRITELPVSICNMTHLQYLNLAYNKLSELPVGFEKLINLKHLNLTKNLIDEIPPVVFELKNLEELLLSKNFIEKIPEDIGKLKSLKILIVNDNKITEVSESILKLKKLSAVSLYENPIYKQFNKLDNAPVSKHELNNFFNNYALQNQIDLAYKNVENYINKNINFIEIADNQVIEDFQFLYKNINFITQKQNIGILPDSEKLMFVIQTLNLTKDLRAEQTIYLHLAVLQQDITNNNLRQIKFRLLKNIYDIIN